MTRAAKHSPAAAQAAQEVVEDVKQGKPAGRVRAPKEWPIPVDDVDGIYSTALHLITEYHSNDLAEAKIGFAWRVGMHQDVDGFVHYFKVSKNNELRQRSTGLDFVITLNRDLWGELSPTQQRAKIDSALCRCAPLLDEEGEQVRDSTGRLEWRLRQPEVQEFSEVVERYGCHTPQLDRMAKAIEASREE